MPADIDGLTYLPWYSNSLKKWKTSIPGARILTYEISSGGGIYVE